MKRIRTICVAAFASAITLSAVDASAQRYDRDRDRGSDYGYCRDEASRLSGYYGERRERGGDVRRGAAQGAALGAIFGKKGKKGKAAKRGAAIGALVGAIKKAERRDRNRRERDLFYCELDRCLGKEVRPQNRPECFDDRPRDRRRDRY